MNSITAIPRARALATALVTAAIALTAAAAGAQDTDMDGTPDELDFCSENALAPVPIGCDTDRDGYGNLCDCDFINIGYCGAHSIGILLGQFGQTGEPGFESADMNCDGVIGSADFGIFVARHGRLPGPSGLDCAGSPGNCPPE